MATPTYQIGTKDGHRGRWVDFIPTSDLALAHRMLQYAIPRHTYVRMREIPSKKILAAYYRGKECIADVIPMRIASVFGDPERH